MEREGKYIHYCWFGGRPLPKLAEQCLESWKKFLPDYEIIRWDENNLDFDECEFVKKAYETKNFAFVADYARAKALNEMGGIYFDTDMEVLKDPHLLMEKNKTFLGVEDTGSVSCGVWYEESPKSYLSTELLKEYRSFKNPDFEKRSEFSIPLLLTKILKKCGFDYKKKKIQTLEHDITIYPREYFYPYSYNRTNNLFTKNTYMVHYFDASWIPLKNRIENALVRKCGRVKAIKMIKLYQKTYVAIRKTARVVLFPVTFYKKYKVKSKIIDAKYLYQMKKTIDEISKYSNVPYLVLYNGGWFGVSSATEELFDYRVDCRELYRKKDIKAVAEAISKSGAKQIIFSAMSVGGIDLVKELKKKDKDILIKVYWHGSMSQVLDSYGWGIHEKIIDLCRDGVITAFATCKESLVEFYRKQGVKVFFITNKVQVPKVSKKRNEKKEDKIRIGLYAASPSNWRKNMFCQMAAASLIEGSVVDIVPVDSLALEFAKTINLEIIGTEKNLAREDLIKRMSQNDVNLYVTFSECAPMLPLESMEVGVPCITGNNHHYFKNSALEKLLVVDQETNIDEIKEKIECCVKNRDEILAEYDKFKKLNAKKAKEDVRLFLEEK